MANVADYNVANASGASVRADLNNILQAVVTLNSGTSAPSTMYPFMIWIDTNTNLVKMRNGANDAWLEMPFSMNASNTIPNSVTISGAVTASGLLTAAAATLSGDLTVDTSTLKVDSTNNRVGIGTATPSSLLTTTKAGDGSNPILHVTDTADTEVAWFEGQRAGDTGAFISVRHNPSSPAESNRSGIKFQADDDGGNVTNYAKIVQYISDNTGGTEDGSLAFNIMDGGSDVEVMRIADSKVGIGTASPARNLVVSSSGQTDLSIVAGTSASAQLQFGDSGDDNIGQIEYNNSSNYMAFSTNAAERLRITSTGAVGIGTTAPAQMLETKTASSIFTIGSTNSHGSAPRGVKIEYSGASPDSAGDHFIYCEDTTAARMTVSSDGDVTTSDAGILTSDRSLKTDIEDATSKLAEINELEVKNFKWIKDYHPNKQNKHIGFIADEFEKVFPGLVKESANPVKDREGTVKSIKYGALIPILVKAVQELSAEVEELKQQAHEKCEN